MIDPGQFISNAAMLGWISGACLWLALQIPAGLWLAKFIGNSNSKGKQK